MLARDIAGTAPPSAEITAPDERDADVTDPDAMERAIASTDPDVIVNCAGYTNVDGAETERERAKRVNGTAPGIIGLAAASPLTAHRSPLVVHFSTDYVFPGTSSTPYRESDRPGPTGFYGETKLAGEYTLAESGARYLIVRTSWLFGPHGKSFPRTMWERACDGKATKVVNDQIGRPTYTRDLARAVWTIVTGHDRRETADGIVHVANSGTATWYDVARRVFEAAGVPDLVTPCSTADYPTPARRPAYSVLDTSRADALVGGPLPTWEDALDRFLGGLRSALGAQRSAS